MTNEPESEVMTFKEFLENTPPGKSIIVSGFTMYIASEPRTGLRSVSRLQDGHYLGTHTLDSIVLTISVQVTDVLKASLKLIVSHYIQMKQAATILRINAKIAKVH